MYQSVFYIKEIGILDLIFFSNVSICYKLDILVNALQLHYFCKIMK